MYINNIYLMINFSGDPNLEFTAMPALLPPETQINPETMAKYEQELKEACNAPLPEDDDDL